MTYVHTCSTLRHLRSTPDKSPVHLDNGIEIHGCAFTSSSSSMLHGAPVYRCDEHDVEFIEHPHDGNHARVHPYPESLKHGDVDILENREFTYALFKKEQPERADGVILLLHGLNERSWEKYLPWAHTLVERTGKAVLLFPIAFHMNRAPSAWGEPRAMNGVSALRRGHSRPILNSSFANAAISSRLEAIPQRFFWSGLQTFNDIVSLIAGIRNGEHALIAPDAGFDIFAYSIGSFLSEILMLANPHGFFEQSKLFMFCGGPTLDRMAPNSKFILDSDATIALYSFYTERLEAELRLDPRIAHYFSDAHGAGPVFRMLLSYQKNKQQRERRFRELETQLHAVALAKDDVIPPNEVLNTLKGDFRDIGSTVEILDFPYPYTHINPFPLEGVPEECVNRSFDEIFDRAAACFNRSADQGDS
jgi:hypothetical protein